MSKVFEITGGADAASFTVDPIDASSADIKSIAGLIADTYDYDVRTKEDRGGGVFVYSNSLALQHVVNVLSSSTFALNSALLNGTSHQFKNATIPVPASVTCAIWFKADDKTVRQGLYGNYNASSGGYHIELRDGNVDFYAYNTATTVFSRAPGAITINSNEWTFAAGSFDAVSDVLKSYVNGVADGSISHPSNIGTSTNSIIGSSPLNTLFFAGSLGVAMTWNRVLTTAEFTELYALGIPKCFNDLSSGLKSGNINFINLGNTTGGELPSGKELIDQAHNSALQNDFSATADPVATDDSAAGYAIDSVIWNTSNGTSWRCTDATASAAVWLKTSFTNIGSTPFTGSGLEVECS